MAVSVIKTVRKEKDLTRKRLNAKEYLVLDLLANGIPFDQAMNTIYGKGTHSMHMWARKITMKNPVFIEALVRELKMKDEFKEAGIDSGWLATQLKTIIEDNNEDPRLRISAIETVKTVLNEDKKNNKFGILSQTLTMQQTNVMQSLPENNIFGKLNSEEIL